jgi:threonine dehydratase
MEGAPQGRVLSVGADDVRAAPRRMEGRVVPTPAAVSATLSDIVGARVAVKFENMQFTASHKERGALNRLLALDDRQRRDGVVAVSAGNFAQAVAYHARVEQVPATIPKLPTAVSDGVPTSFRRHPAGPVVTRR